MADDVTLDAASTLSDCFHERSTLCMPAMDGSGGIYQKGDKEHLEQLKTCFNVYESNATERLVMLKRKLRTLSGDEFCQTLLEEMCDIAEAQYGFVVKRITNNEDDLSIAVPGIGESGPSLVSRAYYYNDGGDNVGYFSNLKCPVFGMSCPYIKYNKTFLIPERYMELIRSNPLPLPFPPEACLTVPLFLNGVCFAHIGVMWKKDGARRRKLSWSYLEMMLYTVEDMVQSQSLTPSSSGKTGVDARPIMAPPEVLTNTSFLKPYAKSLSHELRTPMQGVVGMLDVMYEVVREAAATQSNSKIRNVFGTLKEHIQIVQDSSRRAVEAADNVVQAYYMSVHAPQTPDTSKEQLNSYFPPMAAPIPTEPRPTILVEGHGLSITGKRRRETFDAPIERPSVRLRLSDDGDEPLLTDGSPPTSADSLNLFTVFRDSPYEHGLLPTPVTIDTPSPRIHMTKIRDAVRHSVNEALHTGGRPEMIETTETELGQRIVVKSSLLDKDTPAKAVEWTVQPYVPVSIPVDFPEFTKILGCVFHNAIKFTDAPGHIKIDVTLSQFSRFLMISVVDTGRGIPESFRPRLFRAFSQQDASITRQKDGLGLGLLVARGNTRRLGGDIRLVRTETTGDTRGSEFGIQIPLQGHPHHGPGHDSDDSPSFGPHWRQHRAEASTDSRSSRSTSPQSAVVVTPPPLAPPPRSVRVQTPPRNSSLDWHSAQPTRKLSFLIAEDNTINSKILVSMLRRLGHTAILTAENGQEAVHIMETLPPDHNIDVVLMDLWMPHMDGYEAARKILAQERWKDNVTIMAVSADVTAEALESAANVGMEGYMTKPYKMKDLKKLLDAYFRSRPI